MYNVGTGHSHTLSDLYAALAGIFGFRPAPKYGPVREGDIPHSLADISRARLELGYAPAENFQEGLEKTVAWYLQEGAKQLTTAAAG